MDRSTKMRLIWPSLVPLVPGGVYLKFDMIPALLAGFVVMLVIRFIKVDPRMYKTKKQYYVYCSIILGVIFAGAVLGTLATEHIIFIRLAIVFISMGMLYKYIEKVENM